jgi:hypothetical protein
MEVLHRMRVPALLCIVVLIGFRYGIVHSSHEANLGSTPFNTGAFSQTESTNAPDDEVDTALRSFRARCETPGVIACVDFDDERWFQQGAYVYPAADGVYRATRDTTTKYSGTSSLRFEYPGRTPANGAGAWTMRFGKEFAENSTFYVQYRMRLNDVMVKTDWNKVVSSSWKQSIFHHAGATCANIELTTGRYGWNGANGFPVMYTECGGKGMATNQSNPPYKIQQGGYNCWYAQFNASDCFFYRANEWMIFSFRVSIGTWGKPNSFIQAWVGLDGQKLKKWVDLPNFVLNKDSDSSSYDSVTLLPYMTQKNSKAEHLTGYMWFDELIVSSEPIPDPSEKSK